MSARIDHIQHYNSTFDLIRGLAAITVLLTHTASFIIIPEILIGDKRILVFDAFAALAVEFFFALSGILLGRVLYSKFMEPNKGNDIQVFVLRRWMRTLPVYYLGLAAYFILYHKANLSVPENWPAFFIFLQTPVILNMDFFPVSWSLCIEEIFYVLFPLFVGFFVWAGVRIKGSFIYSAFILIVGCLIARQLYFPYSDGWLFDIRVGSLFRLDSIAVGVLAGIFLGNISRVTAAYAGLFVICCTLMWACFGVGLIINYPLPQLALQISLTFIPWACSIVILYIAQRPSPSPGKISSFFADISYALYVLHLPIMHVMFIYASEWKMPFMSLFYVFVSIATAYLVFRYIETPILKRRLCYKE